MSIEFSQEQWQAIEAASSPLKLVDPATGRAYLLISEAAYARVQSLLEGDLAETYPAQFEAAMRAGWDDPRMDEYNDYDRHHSA